MAAGRGGGGASQPSSNHPALCQRRPSLSKEGILSLTYAVVSSLLNLGL